MYGYSVLLKSDGLKSLAIGATIKPHKSRARCDVLFLCWTADGAGSTFLLQKVHNSANKALATLAWMNADHLKVLMRAFEAMMSLSQYPQNRLDFLEAGAVRLITAVDKMHENDE
eukprot:gene28179-34887_t